MNEMSPERSKGRKASTAEKEFLTFWVGKQLFGLPLLSVQDVLDARALTRVPLAPSEVAGALNLRGRIITAIDTRTRMSVKRSTESNRHMSIVVEHENELYNLIVDRIGDVLRVTDDQFEANPATLSPVWAEFSEGIFRLKDQLMVVLDVATLLDVRH